MSVQTNRPSETHEIGKSLWFWGPVVAYCTFIFVLSTQRDLSPPGFPSSDKVAHFLEYGVLGILWVRAAKTSWPHWSLPLLVVSTSLFTCLYGVTDEWHQFYVPGRYSDWHDALADVSGGTFGAVSYLMGLQFRLRRTSNATPTAPSGKMLNAE